MKTWQELTEKEQNEMVCQMARDLTDLNILNDRTLKLIYNDLYCVKDYTENEFSPCDIEHWLDNEEKELSKENILKLSDYLENNNDANFGFWDNIETGFDRLFK